MTLRIIEGGAHRVPRKKVIAGSGLVDYVWLDPEGHFRVKKRTIPVVFGGAPGDASNLIPIIERWTTTVDDERIVLSCCHYLPDPLRPQPSYIALCEVRDENNVDHPTNTRAKLRAEVDNLGGALDIEGNAILDRLGTWWGYKESFNFPVEANREVPERFLGACLDAGLMIHSATFSTDYFEYRVGPPGVPEGTRPRILPRL